MSLALSCPCPSLRVDARCKGRGCLICDNRDRAEAQIDTRKSVEERRNAEACAFLDGYFNHDSKATGVRLIPNDETVRLVIAAIEHGRQTVRQERQEAMQEPGLEARIALLDFAQEAA